MRDHGLNTETRCTPTPRSTTATPPTSPAGANTLNQHRIRKAVTHVFTLRNARAAALNRWLEEPGALR
jgi:hypothetical protein